MQRRLARSASALLSLFLLPGVLAAATALKPSSGSAVKTAVSTAVRDLPAPEPDPRDNRPAVWIRENEDRPAPLHPRDTGQGDGALQGFEYAPSGGMPAPIVSFDGMNNEDNAAAFGFRLSPPDTDGAVGPTQYVQQVNLLTRVYDKTGAPLTAPFKLSSLFTPFGGTCAGNDDGDPIVLYDVLADRWILSQFALPSFPLPPYHECIAVSTTGDATGTYYLYDFLTPGSEMPDYPKLSVWTDAYYMTTHQFTNGASFNGSGVYALDRGKMLAGDPAATFIYFDLDLTSHPEGIFGILASTLDGLKTPPAGASEIFSYYTADEFGDPGDALRLFEFHPDFSTPADSTFTERAESPLALAAFDPRDPNGRNDIEQPAPGPSLDAVGGRVMYRIAYRILPGGEQSFVLNFTVNVSGVTPNTAATYQAAFRWVELRRDSAGVISVHDQGTYAPGSGNGATGPNRWIASIAQDNQGNSAVGFSLSSTTVFPTIQYAGRLAGDPAGLLSQGEATLIDGSGVQTNGIGRWGDYSALSLDPADDCTFWYTNEYVTAASQATSTVGWLTRVGSFKYPACTAAPKGTLSGQVTSCVGGAAVPGVSLSIEDGAYYRSTDASGNYSFSLPPGTYTVTATHLGYAVGGGQATVTDGNATVLDLCLQPIPITLSAGATLVAESCSPANGVIDPGETVTVSFCAQNVGLVDATSVVGALRSGDGVLDPSDPQGYGTIVVSGPAVCRDFTFTADPTLACGSDLTAAIDFTSDQGDLGSLIYEFKTGIPIIGLTENFDGVAIPALPAGWTTATSGGPLAAWTSVTTASDTAPNAVFSPDPSGGTGNGWINEIVTPNIPITSSSAVLTFRNSYALEDTFDGGVLEISIGGGAFQDILAAGGSFNSGAYTDTIDGGFHNPLAGRQAWSGNSGGFITTSVNLPPGANGQNVRLKWRCGVDQSVAGGGWWVDTVSVNNGYACCQTILPAALTVDANAVTGTASNANGVLEPGERVEVDPSWIRAGGAAAPVAETGTATNLTGPSATYSIDDAAASYGGLSSGIASDCHGASGDCYQMTVSGARPAPHWDATFDEAITTGETKTWTLHVGPSFADVPTSDLFYRFIETIFHNGVTGGCGAPGYCPANPALRKQMAVFLLKSRYGSAYTPPPAVGIFADVPQADAFAPWIEDLYNRGITGGCSASPLSYCPDNTVLRQQMAVFLLKTLEGSSYVPPACTGVFPDVPCPSTFAPWIEDLAARGITGGCGGGNFCPTAPNTRGQMAVFLTKTFALLLYGP